MSPTLKDAPCGVGTDLLHADDEFNGPEVSPSISVTTSMQLPDSFTPGPIFTRVGRQISDRMLSLNTNLKTSKSVLNLPEIQRRTLTPD